MAQIPQEVYNNFEIYLGKEKADEVAEQVRTGVLTVKKAKEWGEQLQKDFEESRGRKDIDPSEWQAFEDGWRPD